MYQQSLKAPIAFVVGASMLTGHTISAIVVWTIVSSVVITEVIISVGWLKLVTFFFMVFQVRECATALLHIAKKHDIPIFLVGHVTKSGDIAGPKVLEHIVDVVLYMEGEKHQSFRWGSVQLLSINHSHCFCFGGKRAHNSFTPLLCTPPPPAPPLPPTVPVLAWYLAVDVY